MAIIKPPVLPPWADAGDKVQPSNAELQQGWPLSNVPPSRQRFNWLLNYLANGIRYFSRRGIADYDAAETYMVGDRVIDPNGKTYRCKVDNTSGVVPSSDAAKWERWGFTLTELNAELTTPAQFDNSTKAATTAFVHTAGLGFPGITVVSANTMLTAENAGQLVSCNGAGGITVTLPLTTGVPIGKGIAIRCNTAPGSVTISRQGGESIVSSQGAATTLTLKQGDVAFFVSNGAGAWTAVFESGSTLFPASLAASGYQRLPSGLILQWGSVTINANNANTDVTLPITFPNAGLQVVASVGGANSSQFAVGAAFASTSVARFNCGHTTSVFGRYIAIGH